MYHHFLYIRFYFSFRFAGYSHALASIFATSHVRQREAESQPTSEGSSNVDAAETSIDFEGIIEITHDKGWSSFKVSGPADDDRYTVRGITSKREAVETAHEEAHRKADDAGGPVRIVSFIGENPIEETVYPSSCLSN